MAAAGVGDADLAATVSAFASLDAAVVDEVVTRLGVFPPAIGDPFLRSLPRELSHLSRPTRSPGTPIGEQITVEIDGTSIFPGTTRTVAVWVPRAYTGESPACTHVELDGLSDNLQQAIDELVTAGDMPVTIAIGIPSGRFTGSGSAPLGYFNRSREFDTVSGELAAFVLDEVLPRIDGLRTSDGRVVRLSDRGVDRSVGGGSTGAPAAFGVAWHRPDAFSRVLSLVGTFVGMRGSHQWPLLVRKSEPKALRVFLQDGSNDWVDGPYEDAGDWWLGNLTMEKALSVAGYDVEHSWSESQHFSWHAEAVIFDAFRWLWRDYPEPIVAGTSRNLVLAETVEPGDGWTRIDETWETPDVVAPDGVPFDDIVGSAVTDDGAWLAVTRRGSRHGWGFALDEHGSVLAGDRFYRFVVVDDSDEPGTGPLAFDRTGRLFAASALGVQVFDSQGVARTILTSPVEQIVALRIRSEPVDALDVLGGDGHAYRRRLKVGSAS